MTLRVAITRALPEAERTAERVRALGHQAFLAPLLAIVPCAYDTSTEGAQAIIFTSSNGVRAFPDARGARNRIVLAVGDATAEAARQAGFADVRSAAGDVNALAALAQAALDPAGGKLIHIGGDHIAGDLSGQLAAAGFKVERRVAYAAVAASTLPEAFTEPLDLVLFHSARAARVFLSFGAPGAQRLAAICLSAAVAEAAEAAPWKRLITARQANEADLLDVAFG